MTDPNITINNLGRNCPVQAEGTIDGHAFYFRARGSHWSIELAQGDGVFLSELSNADYNQWVATWEYYERWGEWPDAGWMEIEDAMWLIHRAAMLYRQSLR